jgi:hypothetical protein
VSAFKLLTCFLILVITDGGPWQTLRSNNMLVFLVFFFWFLAAGGGVIAVVP